MGKKQFNELGISPELLRAVEKMGFVQATEIQGMALPPLLEGKDVTAQAPTGTGKTCAFGIPLVERVNPSENKIQALVLCPTRELALQITEQLTMLAAFRRGIRVTPVYGGQSIERQLTALKKRPQILVATPGRLMDHLRRHTVRLNALTMLVLDEADEMLNMGFREDIDTILKSVPQKRQTMLFSATLSKEILDIARHYQDNAVVVKATQAQLTVDSVEQYYLSVRGQNKFELLVRLLEEKKFRLCLVFCNTKRMVDELAVRLFSRGFRAQALHGDMKQAQRDRVMAGFRRGRVDILIATDVAARGIDVEDIDAVINYDLPNDDDFYVHRIGRTGRAERTGEAYTFVQGKEQVRLQNLMRFTKAKIRPLQIGGASHATGQPEQDQVDRILQEAQQLTHNTDLSAFSRRVEEYLAQNGKNQTKELCAALLCLSLGDRRADRPLLEKKVATPEKQYSETDRMVRLFMNIGELDELRRPDFVELICQSADLDGASVGAVDVHDKFSFVEVPGRYAGTVIRSLSGQRLRGRSISVQIANQRRR